MPPLRTAGRRPARVRAPTQEVCAAEQDAEDILDGRDTRRVCDRAHLRMGGGGASEHIPPAGARARSRRSARARLCFHTPARWDASGTAAARACILEPTWAARPLGCSAAFLPMCIWHMPGAPPPLIVFTAQDDPDLQTQAGPACPPSCLVVCRAVDP
jgi:hypothetical protein